MCPCKIRNFSRLLFATLVLGLAGPAARLPAAAEAARGAGVTVEQKDALDVLDRVITRFEALLARDDDVRHKAATQERLDELKERRNALHREYDQARYDELRVDLNLEYQRLASWMAQPKTPPPAETAGPTPAPKK